MFFSLCQALFSGFLQFNGNFVDAVDAKNNSKYRDCATLTTLFNIAYFEGLPFPEEKIHFELIRNTRLYLTSHVVSMSVLAIGIIPRVKSGPA